MGASVAPAQPSAALPQTIPGNVAVGFRGKRGRSRWVDFPEPKGNNLRVSLVFLAAVNVIIWIGLFAYLRRLDRRISARERER